MILHELSTNAVKYGALSTDEGVVSIEWDVAGTADGQQRLRLVWREAGGPQVTPPARKGFGSTLIERALQGYGKTSIAYLPSGIVCTLECDV